MARDGSNSRNVRWWPPLALVLALQSPILAVQSDDELAFAEERAFAAAVERVAACVVMIETVGGLDERGQLGAGSGATTGLIISADGRVVSSAFGFTNNPRSIVVTLADGTRTRARLVATDHSRKIVLLRLEPNRAWPAIEIVPADEVKVGQWSIAVGRTFDAARVNASVGLISATGRVWGQAIQTDAKVSPNNYGGPLVDIHGRVFGILAPMSHESSDTLAGVDWYDSGIAFAVPMADVLAAAERLDQGQDLRPGIVGLALKGADLYSGPVVIETVRPGSPAARAGLRAGDEIVAADGRPIIWRADMMGVIRRRYAEDSLQVTIRRGDVVFDESLELTDSLETYVRPLLGVLVSRVEEGDTRGVLVRGVFEVSAARAAELRPGDVIESIDDVKVGSPTELAAVVAGRMPDDEVTISLARDGQSIDTVAKLSGDIETAEDLANVDTIARRDSAPDAAPEGIGRARLGRFGVKLPAFANECVAYVPNTYDARRPMGLLVYLHGAGHDDRGGVVDAWRETCDQQGFILAAPRSANPSEWHSGEAEFIRAVIERFRGEYAIDAGRVALVGNNMGAMLGWRMAFQAEKFGFRGFAAIDAALPRFMTPSAAEPAAALRFFLARVTDMEETDFEFTEANLRQTGHAVTVVEDDASDERAGGASNGLSPAAAAVLNAWLAALDRI